MDAAAGPVLNTERMILTPVGLEDFADLRRLWSEADFVRHIVGRALTTEEVWFRLLRDIGHWRALGRGNWSMRLRDGGAYVGSVGVLDYRRDLDPPFDAPELGWGLSPAMQGKGLALEGLRAALAWADDVLGAPRTVCMIAPDNGASIRLAEKAGYTRYAEGDYKGAATWLFERIRS